MTVLHYFETLSDAQPAESIDVSGGAVRVGIASGGKFEFEIRLATAQHWLAASSEVSVAVV